MIPHQALILWRMLTAAYGTQRSGHPTAVPGLLSGHSCHRQRPAGRSEGAALDPLQVGRAKML